MTQMSKGNAEEFYAFYVTNVGVSKVNNNCMPMTYIGHKLIEAGIYSG